MRFAARFAAPFLTLGGLGLLGILALVPSLNPAIEQIRRMLAHGTTHVVCWLATPFLVGMGF
jgi:hypothetical protein